MSKSKDNVAKGQGCDGDLGVDFVVKQVDRKKEREHFGSVCDVTPKHPGKA